MRERWLGSALRQTLTLTLTPSRRRPHRRQFSSAADKSGVSVKKVTRSNFEAAMEDLQPWIRDSDFVAVDLEMTGLTSAPWRDAFEFDRSDVRYLKVKDSAEKFAVVQFGVCPFRWDASKGSFIAHPHNFYIFPRKELPIDGPTYEFLCQTTSIDFLAKHKFDFNACIHEGISYLSREQEAEALQSLSSARGDKIPNSLYNTDECIEIPIVSTYDLLFTERMKNKFREWRDEILKGPDGGSRLEGNHVGPKMQFQTVFYKMRPAVMLDGISSHQAKLIKLVLKKHFKDLVYVRANCENLSWQKIVVYVDSKEDGETLMKEVQNDQLRNMKAKVRSAVGFRHVIDLLASEKKLIVGHNCFLDIAHMHSKFFGPLPSSMVDFALSVHKNFPYIIDTKHLLNVSPAIQHLMKKSSKSLSSAFLRLCPKISTDSQNSFHSYVKVEVHSDETRSTCWNSGAKHEAGYDAFMTGCVFAQSCSHLGIEFEVNSDLVRNDKLKKHVNLLHPSWNSGTLIDLSTGVESPESPESAYKRKYPKMEFANMLLLWGFPRDVNPNGLKECIGKVFGLDSVTSIFFLDPTAALVQFSKEELVGDFLTLKDNLERDDGLVSVLHPLAKLLETRAADYDVYRKICISSRSKFFFADQAEAMGIKWKNKMESGVTEADGFASNENRSVDELEPMKKRKGNQERQPHHVSCEDILDSLYASKSMLR